MQQVMRSLRWFAKRFAVAFDYSTGFDGFGSEMVTRQTSFEVAFFKQSITRQLGTSEGLRLQVNIAASSGREEFVFVFRCTLLALLRPLDAPHGNSREIAGVGSTRARN
jgi:hypothetical protein